jgi:hypothetical protein
LHFTLHNSHLTSSIIEEERCISYTEEGLLLNRVIRNNSGNEESYKYHLRKTERNGDYDIQSY